MSDSRGIKAFEEMQPDVLEDNIALRRVLNSTVLLSDLLARKVLASSIESCFATNQGCGAVLVALDDEKARDLYSSFYELQWQCGNRVFKSMAARDKARSELAQLAASVKKLLTSCGLEVSRARCGKGKKCDLKVGPLISHQARQLASRIGRPLVSNRYEFHPSVDFLLKQELLGALQSEGNIKEGIVSVKSRGGETCVTQGPRYADEVRLLSNYREWHRSKPDIKSSHGFKYNGDVYYGAYRGTMHFDVGSTCTTLFGPGEVRDGKNKPAVNECLKKVGGTLLVAAPGETKFTPLPYRLRSNLPYIVVFFEKFVGGDKNMLNIEALGWKPTCHGVQRVRDTSFSRGQVVVHVKVHSKTLGGSRDARSCK